MKRLNRRILRQIDILRSRYHLRKGRRLTNRTPTILSNNCVGGIIYHDLGLQFCSPTVNLRMDPADFLTLLENLEAFFAADVEEEFMEGVQYPIGRLTIPGGASIRLDFMHYSTFQEARQKWNDRKKRVDLNNLFAILHYPGDLVSEDQLTETVRRFERIDVPGKAMLTAVRGDAIPDAAGIVFCSRPDFRAERILEYKGKYSMRRFLDDFDYVSFLNSGSD